MCDYPFFIPQVVLFANSSLFWFKVTNEHREFRNYLIVTVHSNLFKPYFLKIPEIIIHRLIVSYIPNHEKYFFRFRPTFVQRCTHSDVSRTQSYKKYGFRSIFQQTFCHGFHCTPCRIHIIDHKNSQACYRP